MDFRNLEITEKRKILKDIISKFDLKPLPFEGGYFIETFRSEKKVISDENPDTAGFPENEWLIENNQQHEKMYP